MINNTNIQKQKYEKSKENYFESCKLAEKQEKKLLEEMNKHGNNEEGIKIQNNILTKFRVQSQEDYQKYKDEHQKTNKLYNDYNTKYFKLINAIKDNEEKRINYLSFHIDKFITILTEEKNSFAEKELGLIPLEDYIVGVRSKKPPIISLNQEGFTPLEILGEVIRKNKGKLMKIKVLIVLIVLMKRKIFKIIIL